ncbi:toprim domain-containing protein [Bdellovibrio bacteriovorus]|uniref:DUF7146 domain-containing protein n=1 Tax=Bdellovibrio bacteriovorus TaxID=959 RepID=UPI0035A5FF37
MKVFDLKDVKNKANGHWLGVLSKNGIPAHFLTNKNGPCPFCGGKNRWRWDNKDGNGSGYCHQCDARGDGFKILGKWLDLSSRKDFPKLLRIVAESLVGIDCFGFGNTAIYPASKGKSIESVKKFWAESQAIYESSPAAIYLASRGLMNPGEIEGLRWHPNMPFYHDNKYVGRFPALVSKISDFNKNITGIHRIYLTEEGEKLTLGEPKKILGSVAGGAIRFDEPKEILHIAEGVETSLAIREVVKEPTWSAISATNLRRVAVPDKVVTVVIWADLDANLVGEMAAAELARRLCHEGKTVFVKVPEPIPQSDLKKADWLDVYNHMQSNGWLYGL